MYALEDVLVNEAKVTINGSESTLDVGPVLGVVVVNVGVSVVKVGAVSGLARQDNAKQIGPDV